MQYLFAWMHFRYSKMQNKRLGRFCKCPLQISINRLHKNRTNWVTKRNLLAGFELGWLFYFFNWIIICLHSANVETYPAYCTIKSCIAVPVTLTTDACSGYFTNCTTKNGVGCVIESTFSAVTIKAAFTTAINGTICAWDGAQNKCKDKDCQDFSGNSHAEFQAYKARCTAGARVQNCEQTTNRNACIQGTNRPCLQINGYDRFKGAWFKYTSCKSLSWNSDAQCKWISKQCTKNGFNCIGITLCSETKTAGVCVTGYDGASIQSVPALNSGLQSYTSCTHAFYKTHSYCQIASSKCTTKGTTGCIALGACSFYAQQTGCYFNDKVVLYALGVITSINIGTLDKTSNSCRDQSCADLNGKTHNYPHGHQMEQLVQSKEHIHHTQLQLLDLMEPAIRNLHQLQIIRLLNADYLPDLIFKMVQEPMFFQYHCHHVYQKELLVFKKLTTQPIQLKQHVIQMDWIEFVSLLNRLQLELLLVLNHVLQ